VKLKILVAGLWEELEMGRSVEENDVKWSAGMGMEGTA
jgi:hypothetical protein